MVSITTSRDYEILVSLDLLPLIQKLSLILVLQFTSCSPMEATSSRAHRQVLRLSQFEPSLTAGASEVATFVMAANPPIPQALDLDDEESFGMNLVA